MRVEASGTNLDRNDDALRFAQVWGYRFFDAASVADVAAAILAGYRGQDDELPLLVTPNVDILVTLEDNERLRHIVSKSAYVLADGQPLVSFSRLGGDRLQARLAGSDLTAAIWPKLRSAGASILAIVSDESVAEALEADNPACRAIVAPMISAEPDSEDFAEFAKACLFAAAGMAEPPEFVFIGIGFPKDCLLGSELLERWPLEKAPMVLAVGASMEFMTGVKTRAPKVMQRFGLEFVHRIAAEPRRLLRRYLIRDSRFLVILARHTLRNLLGR